jgi:conjugal transfer pilus assembly protein TrbC
MAKSTLNTLIQWIGTLGAVALLCPSLPTFAQGVTSAPSAGKSVPVFPAEKALEDAIRAQAARSEAVLQKSRNLPPSQIAPTVDLSKLKNADLSRIAEQYQAVKEAGEVAQREEGLLIFISLSMPAESLSRLVDQAIRFNAPLIIRGTEKDSLAATVAKVTTILKQREAEIQIDPRLFTRFKIDSVPAFVAIEPNANKYGVVYGDVTTDYALQTMERSMPSVANYAKQRLASVQDNARSDKARSGAVR